MPATGVYLHRGRFHQAQRQEFTWRGSRETTLAVRALFILLFATMKAPRNCCFRRPTRRGKLTTVGSGPDKVPAIVSMYTEETIRLWCLSAAQRRLATTGHSL